MQCTFHFHDIMSDVLHPFIDSFVIVYLDDIVIFSNMWQEHLTHVTQVLETLRKNQVIANLQKCEFDNTSLKYIGHMIGAGELRVDPEKIKEEGSFVFGMHAMKVEFSAFKI